MSILETQPQADIRLGRPGEKLKLSAVTMIGAAALLALISLAHAGAFSGL